MLLKGVCSMKIECNDLITLDNGTDYLIVNKIMNSSHEYYYMINKDDVSDFKFCYLDDDEIVEILDENNINDLMVLFGINNS